MKKTLLAIGLAVASVASASAQGYFQHTYVLGTGVTEGLTPQPGTSPGDFLGSDYSVQLYAASGFNVSTNSLAAISGSITTFFGVTGNQTQSNGEGLFDNGALVNTGLAVGNATVQARAGTVVVVLTSYEAAILANVAYGESLTFNVSLVDNQAPTFSSWDSISMPAFTVQAVPEPGTFALAGLGAAALLALRRRK